MLIIIIIIIFIIIMLIQCIERVVVYYLALFIHCAALFKLFYAES